MATVYKVLGQSAPSGATDTSLYTVPSATSAVVSTLSICNRGVSTTFRAAVRPAGATLADEHYIVYDNFVNAGDAVFLTLGITLAATDVVTVRAGTADMSFSLFGSELT
jgi:hypothetical protein